MLRLVYRLLLRITPVVFGLLGWRFGGWLGAVAGVFFGCGAAVAAWVVIYYFTFQRRLQRRRDRVAQLANDLLLEIAANPASPDLGFAIGELARRGVEAVPPLSSLFELLTSADSNRRGLGMSLMMALYPQVWSKVSLGSSNLDAPEVWRSRLEAFQGPT